MAKQIKRTSKQQKQRQRKSTQWIFPFFRQNFIIAGIGIGVIILGFILMATGITEEAAVPNGKWNNFFAISIAPVLLVLGYCVIIPYAIMKFFGEKSEPETE